MVTELVPSEQNYVSLAIADAVGKKNKAYLYQLLGGYYAEGGDDEQGKTLALIGLLADQFRSQLQVKNALENRATDADILAVTNWKPGRLFVVKRLAGAFTERQLRDGLTKLETLDVELKTTSTPPRVVMELILAQMM
jgi:DNA polymerase III delta subunit